MIVNYSSTGDKQTHSRNKDFKLIAKTSNFCMNKVKFIIVCVETSPKSTPVLSHSNVGKKRTQPPTDSDNLYGQFTNG